MSYNSEQLEKLKTRYNDGEIEKHTYEFLTDGNRVEINAFAPTEFEQYVTERLEELGVEKAAPSVDKVETPEVNSREEVREKGINKAIAEYVANQIDDDICGSIFEEDERLELDDKEDEEDAADAEEVHEELSARLDNRPPKSWQELNEEVNDELTEDLKERNEELSDTVESAVEGLLDD